VVITRLTPTVVMHALSESVAIMVKHVMGHLYHKILNHSGHKSAQLFVKDDVNVTLAIIAILTAVNVSRFNTVPIMDSVAKMNTGMNVEAIARKINVLIY